MWLNCRWASAQQVLASRMASSTKAALEDDMFELEGLLCLGGASAASGAQSSAQVKREVAKEEVRVARPAMGVGGARADDALFRAAFGAGASTDQVAQDDDDDEGEEEEDKEASDNEVDPTPTKSIQGGADSESHNYICNLCSSGSADADLSCYAANARTPFDRVRSWTAASSMVCDNCFTYVRFQMESETVGSVLKACQQSEAAREKYLFEFSCFLAVKNIDPGVKVHKHSLGKAVAMISEQRRILADLQSRGGNSTSTTSRSDARLNPPTTMVYGLAEYVRSKGNPLVNGHEVVLGYSGDQLTLMVKGDGDWSGRGRHSLKDLVRSAADGITSPELEKLGLLSVDSLEVAKMLKSVVVEFSSRESLRRQVSAQALPQAPARSRHRSQGSLPSTTSRSRSPRARSSGPAAVASSHGDQEPTDILPSSHITPTKPSKRTAARSPTSSRRVASPTTPVAEASDISGSTPAGLMERISEVGEVTQNMPKIKFGRDKDMDQMAKRVMGHCQLFVILDWRQKLRGKESAIHNTIVAIKKMIAAAGLEQREDKVAPLGVMQSVAEACMALTTGSRLKGLVVYKLNPMRLHANVSLVAAFMDFYGDHFGIPGEKRTVVTELKKLEVVVVTTIVDHPSTPANPLTVLPMS